MSKRKTAFPSSELPAEEAEEFMALMLAAQSEEHNCPWVNYFKKVGNRMVSQYIKKE